MADSTSPSTWSPPVATTRLAGASARGSMLPTADCQPSSTIRYPSLARTLLIDARISGENAIVGTATPCPIESAETRSVNQILSSRGPRES
jgi:hypothetical protein